MKILLSSPGPVVATLYQQFVQALAGEHEVAVVSRHAIYLSLFAEAGIRTYDPWTLEIQARDRIDAQCAELRTVQLEAWRWRKLDLWVATALERRRQRIARDEEPLNVLERSVPIALSAHTFLADFNPDVVIVWNGHFLENKIYAELASRAGSTVYFMERGLLPDSLVLDPRGVNAQSILCSEDEGKDFTVEDDPPAETAKRVAQYLEGFRSAKRSVVRQPGSTSGPSIRRAFELPENSRLILVPGQIDWDSNILLNAPNYETNLDVLQALEAYVKKRRDVYVLFKTHPEEPAPRRFTGALSARFRVVEEANLHELIDAADVVVTRNSTVGLEAVARIRPVVVLGRSIYSGKGFTYDVEVPHDLPRQIDNAFRAGLTQEMVSASEKFFGVLLNDYLYFRPDAEVFPGRNGGLLKKHFSSRSPMPPVYERPGVLHREWGKARKRSETTIARVTRDRASAQKLLDAPARHALVIRFCAPEIFVKMLGDVARSGIAKEFTVLPRKAGLVQEVDSVPGVIKVIKSNPAAWLEGLKARLSAYQVVLFLLDNAHQVSGRVRSLRQSLAPVQVLGLDLGWTEINQAKVDASKDRS